jgi:hypothetical protein
MGQPARRPAPFFWRKQAKTVGPAPSDASCKFLRTQVKNEREQVSESSESTWMTLRAAAKLIGHETQTTRKWVKAGRFPSAERSETGYYRIARDEVIAEVEKRAAAQKARIDRRRAARLAAAERKATACQS